MGTVWFMAPANPKTMKTIATKISLSAAFAACALVTNSQASTILVDYNDGVVGGGHDVAVNGGDFTNDNTAGALPSEWVYNLGTGLAAWKDDSVSNVGSIGNLTIGHDSGTAGDSTKIPGVDTGVTISVGDTFDVSFMWLDAVRWDADDTVSLSLFFTDTNLIGGTATDVLTFTSDVSAAASTWQTDSDTGLAYNGDEVAGKKLFARIDSTAAPREFARLDNVYIEVNTVPEASSAALLGLGGLALILRRRK